MAVTVSHCSRFKTGLNDYEFKGTSRDTKPTENVGINSLFFELDTGDIYYYTGETWAKVGGNV